jgi:hypothetical protein
MIKSLFTSVLLLLIGKFAFSQCIDKKLVKEGLQFTNYIHPRFSSDNTPYSTVYTFYPNGEVYNAGHALVKNTIDIKQAAANASKYKYRVDNAIKVYASKRFFSELRFQSVSVEYPEPDWIPDSVLENSTLYKEDSVLRKLHKLAIKTKDNYTYCYTYEFKADSLSSYPFNLVVDKYGRVIRHFYFPSKNQYKPLNKHFTYCQLINIARKSQKHIDTIESIQLSYNTSEKRFYWVISQHIADTHQDGSYHFNVVQIDAANLSKVKRTMGTLMVGPSEP